VVAMSPSAGSVVNQSTTVITLTYYGICT
jgi:hypothetical protein